MALAVDKLTKNGIVPDRSARATQNGDAWLGTISPSSPPNKWCQASPNMLVQQTTCGSRYAQKSKVAIWELVALETIFLERPY
jgi:hypothetical protein